MSGSGSKGAAWWLLLLCGLASFAGATNPWCPVQIGKAGWVSTAPFPGIKMSAQATWAGDATGYPGSGNLAWYASTPLFGSAMCVLGGGATSGPCTGTKELQVQMGQLDDYDVLCSDPTVHKYTFQVFFGTGYSQTMTGAAERTDCTLGKPDYHGHCVVNSCVAGTLAASGVYKLGVLPSNSATTSCSLAVGGTPCEVAWAPTGPVTARLVSGLATNYQAGKYVQTGNLCAINAGEPPAMVASMPANSCGTGMQIYNDPSTGLDRCIPTGTTGTPDPNAQGLGSGGSGGGGFPTSCPSWLGAVCSWFAETDEPAETLAAQKSGRVSDPNAPATSLPESNIQVNEQMVGSTSPFFTGRYNFATGCPANPVIDMMGHGTFIIPYNKVCDFGNQYINPASGILSFLIALGIAFRGSSA